MGVFGCFEVTIGWFGKERVDYMTYDTNGIFRCYEIKVTKADFRSKNANTFVGHYNYYVMPYDLYEEVKDEIPSHIGVHSGKNCLKKAKKQKLGVDEQVLKDSLIRSLSRYFENELRSNDEPRIKRYKREIQRLKKERDSYYQQYIKLDMFKRKLEYEDLLRNP